MTAQIGDRLEIMGRQVHAGVHIPFVDGEHIERLKEPCSDVSRGLVSSTACSRGYRADLRTDALCAATALSSDVLDQEAVETASQATAGPGNM